MKPRTRSLLTIAAALGALVIVVSALELDTSKWFHAGGSGSLGRTSSANANGSAAGVASRPGARALTGRRWQRPASGATLSVPGTYPDIQSAVDAASNGDTIEITD